MISVEEKLLVNVLYRPESEILNGIEINDINFDNLIKLASRHLMLPALFFFFIKKNVSCLFPEDFIEYIKNIYSINKARNTVLLKEAKELSELLYKNNINHIFLKGTALLLSNVFEDIGERMMCDIDFIIQHKDEQKIEEVLEKNNWFTSDIVLGFKIFKNKHLPRMVNKNKTIAIEPHLELLSLGWRGNFNSKKLINAFKDKTKTIKTPSKPFLFDHCINALQIEDRRFFNSHHSHRSIYDIYRLDCKKSLTIKNIKKDIFIKHFFITIDKFKIFDIHVNDNLFNLYFDKLCRAVIKSQLSILSSRVFSIFKQLINLFVSSAYRKHVLNKISNHYYNKTLLNYLYTWLKA